MARWRAEAIRRLPELRQVIVSANSVMALWIELFRAFRKAYEREPRDEALIARIYNYADWCMQAPRGPDAGHDPFTAVTVAFYEDIPRFQPAREDMPRWFPYSEVAQNKHVFAYHLSDEEFADLVRHMEKNQERYQPRDRPPDEPSGVR
jgi:hypothetical protein